MTGGPRGVLRVGDRVRFEGREQQVVGLAGTTVRLQDDHGGVALVLFSHLVAAADFELLSAQPSVVPLPPFGMLGWPRRRRPRPNRRAAPHHA